MLAEHLQIHSNTLSQRMNTTNLALISLLLLYACSQTAGNLSVPCETTLETARKRVYDVLQAPCVASEKELISDCKFVASRVFSLIVFKSLV